MDNSQTVNCGKSEDGKDDICCLILASHGSDDGEEEEDDRERRRNVIGICWKNSNHLRLKEVL